MHLLRAGTISVKDLAASQATYEEWLDYSTVETGTISAELASSWQTPASAGAAYAVLQPASGADIFLRMIEAAPVDGFVPLISYGWAALEFCVQDVLAVHERMQRSPFEVIGPPRKIDGLDAIHPMQVRGPDGEIAYFTQINDDLPDFTLPRAGCLIDHLFINVLAASDMYATQNFLADHLGLTIGRDNMEIVYTMLAKAFGADDGTLYSISTIVHETDVFFEVDQLPPEATVRPKHDGQLPPGISMTTMKVASLDAISAPFHTPPVSRDGAIYGGQRTATVSDPDGALFELVEIG